MSHQIYGHAPWLIGYPSSRQGKARSSCVMGPVETLSINAIDVPHASGQVGISGLDQDMTMIAK